ncbi:unnamed protein product [Gordionus sp. m RMFG-2023]
MIEIIYYILHLKDDNISQTTKNVNSKINPYVTTEQISISNDIGYESSYNIRNTNSSPIDFSQPLISDLVSFQCIQWHTFQPTTWSSLYTQDLAPLSTPSFTVIADKGFNYSTVDESFVCQKKNHFQITMDICLQNDPKFLKLSSGLFKPIRNFYAIFYGVKAESVSQIIKIEQSQSDRSKKSFNPIQLSLVLGKPQKITIGRLHFSETTINNMRKKGKPNPDQRYFLLIVALCARVGKVNNDFKPNESVNAKMARFENEDFEDHILSAFASEKIIVRASNPGQFDNDPDSTWQKGQGAETICHMGQVGINTENPDESLVVQGNIKLTGHILQPSDIRIKTNIVELDTKQQLHNVSQIKLYHYKYDSAQVGDFVREGDSLSDTGVIAQELEKVLPEAVKKSGCWHLPNGKIIQDFMIVNKERIFLENVGAVKELTKLTSTLGTRIEKLEKLNKALPHRKQESFRSISGLSNSLSYTSSITIHSSSKLSSPKDAYKKIMDETLGARTFRYAWNKMLRNKFLQFSCAFITLIMGFCLITMSTLFVLEYMHRHKSMIDYNETLGRNINNLIPKITKEPPFQQPLYNLMGISNSRSFPQTIDKTIKNDLTTSNLFSYKFGPYLKDRTLKISSLNVENNSLNYNNSVSSKTVSLFFHHIIDFATSKTIELVDKYTNSTDILYGQEITYSPSIFQSDLLIPLPIPSHMLACFKIHQAVCPTYCCNNSSTTYYFRKGKIPKYLVPLYNVESPTLIPGFGNKLVEVLKDVSQENKEDLYDLKRLDESGYSKSDTRPSSSYSNAKEIFQKNNIAKLDKKNFTNNHNYLPNVTMLINENININLFSTINDNENNRIFQNTLKKPINHIKQPKTYNSINKNLAYTAIKMKKYINTTFIRKISYFTKADIKGMKMSLDITQSTPEFITQVSSYPNKNFIVTKNSYPTIFLNGSKLLIKKSYQKFKDGRSVDNYTSININRQKETQKNIVFTMLRHDKPQIKIKTVRIRKRPLNNDIWSNVSTPFWLNLQDAHADENGETWIPLQQNLLPKSQISVILGNIFHGDDKSNKQYDLHLLSKRKRKYHKRSESLIKKHRISRSLNGKSLNSTYEFNNDLSNIMVKNIKLLELDKILLCKQSIYTYRDSNSSTDNIIISDKCANLADQSFRFSIPLAFPFIPITIEFEIDKNNSLVLCNHYLSHMPCKPKIYPSMQQANFKAFKNRWRLPIGQYFWSSYNFRIANTKSLSISSEVCNWTKESLGKKYSQCNLFFQRMPCESI